MIPHTSPPRTLFPPAGPCPPRRPRARESAECPPTRPRRGPFSRPGGPAALGGRASATAILRREPAHAALEGLPRAPRDPDPDPPLAAPRPRGGRRDLIVYPRPEPRPRPPGRPPPPPPSLGPSPSSRSPAPGGARGRP